MEIKKFKFNGNEIFSSTFIKDKVYEGKMVNNRWYFMDEFWESAGYTIGDLNILINGAFVSNSELAHSFEEVNYNIGVDIAKGDDYIVTN